jgi:hypothetical protein
MLRVTCEMRPVTCEMRLSTCEMRLSTCEMRLVAKPGGAREATTAIVKPTPLLVDSERSAAGALPPLRAA